MEIAKQTMEIVERGIYTTVDNHQVDLTISIRGCRDGTRLFSPAELEQLRSAVLTKPSEDLATSYEVVNETTLSGITRMSAESTESIAVLNFASAKNPGGGFLGGSQAQEESLARSSALYASLLQAWDFYEQHRSAPSLLYSDAMILSPGCPVFRDDEGNLLNRPQHAAFITSPAPNAGAAATNAPEEVHAIPEVFRRRSELVLALAAFHGYKHLILGAWGCGVFRNDPKVVAQSFADHLKGAWAGRFKRVLFSVLDASPERETFEVFRQTMNSVAP